MAHKSYHTAIIELSTGQVIHTLKGSNLPVEFTDKTLYYKFCTMAFSQADIAQQALYYYNKYEVTNATHRAADKTAPKLKPPKG